MPSSSRHSTGSAKSHYASSGKRHHRERRHPEPAVPVLSTSPGHASGAGADTRSCAGLTMKHPRSDSKTSRVRIVQEHSSSDFKPQPYQHLPHQMQHQHTGQQGKVEKTDNFEDFIKYLGLAEGSADSLRARRRSVARESSFKSANHHQPSDALISSTSGGGSHHARYAVPSHPHPQAPSLLTLPPQPPQPTSPQPAPSQQHHQQSPPQPPLPPLPPLPSQPASEEFADEEGFFQLVDRMLTHAEKASSGGRQHRMDAEAVVDALRRFGGDFGDCVCRFHRKRLDAFPFYQPDMLKMLDLLNGSFATGSSDILLFTEQLRTVHLSMRLFLRPADTLAEVDDSALTRLLLAYSEQLDRDLRALPSSGSSTASVTSDTVRYARRRVTALAAAVVRYTRTVERRRQMVLGRMQTLAATVMGFVSRCPLSSGGSGESSFRKAIVDLFDDMLTCFSSLGSTGRSSIDSVISASATDLTGGKRSRAISPAVHSDDGLTDGCGDTMSATSRPFQPPPPPHISSMTLPHSDNEEAASVTSDVDTGCVGRDTGVADREDADEENAGHGCGAVSSPEVSPSVSTTSVEPQEALSLQLIERLEGLLTSFLQNERVNNQEFKAAFVALYDWWRRVSVGRVGGGSSACDRRVVNRMATIREQFDCTQRHRADSSGVKRLRSEADTAWELIEVAKLMMPSEERTAALMLAHTAPEWREATGTLVDTVLATLYLYQTAPDASVLSMRLRADLQRLVNRLADCGPVPLLCLLRLRLMYLRARQFSDLLRAHPQGCLILDLAQTHRTFHRDDYPDGSVPLNLTVCVPLNDYRKFCQHIKDMRVLSFEARAPVTEKTCQLTKASCLKKIEKCCQCTIEFHPPASANAAASPMTNATLSTSNAAIPSASATPSEDAMTMGGRRKPQLVVGGTRPNFSLVIRPDVSNGRANAAMRMINDIVGPASIGDQVKYRGFHLSVSMPQNYRPLPTFPDTSRPLTC